MFCLALLIIIANGELVVDPDEVKSVSVMEGESVTLHTDITQIQRNYQINWLFDQTLIAEIQFGSIYDDYEERFKDRLKLDSQTGSLTITNITITDSGLYKLKIINSRTSYKRFNVTVYARLPVPVIINSSQCSSSSSSKCVLLCSVLNVRDASLSWYKGNSLLSSISVSDLNIRLSLPLEVKYQDTNTYSCVLNSTIKNQTQHLTIKDVCQQSSELHWLILPIVGSVVLLVAVVVGVICCRYKKKINQEEEAQVPPVETLRFQTLMEAGARLKNTRMHATHQGPVAPAWHTL